MFLFTFTMFFSGGMIPMYLTVQQLHIYNTTWAMVLPVAVSAYNLIVCRSFFESGIPVELLEAAKIDGCSDFGFFFKIAIPLSKTIIAVMCLFYATAMWNQFFNALMFLQDDSKMPLQVVLRNLVLMNQSNQMGSSASEMVTKQKLAEQLKILRCSCFRIPTAVRISFPAEILRKRCYDRCSQADTEQKSYRYRVHGYNRHDFIVETQKYLRISLPKRQQNKGGTT